MNIEIITRHATQSIECRIIAYSGELISSGISYPVSPMRMDDETILPGVPATAKEATSRALAKLKCTLDEATKVAEKAGLL